MRVRVLLFALYRDLAGQGEIDLEIEAPATAATAVARLRALGHGFARLPDRPVVAVNQEYARLDAVLGDGDELALLPPVAGG
jgi:molybdopterin converting factor small subunit